VSDERRAECLLDGSTLRVSDVRCFASAGGPGPQECADETQVVLPIGGVFEVRHGHGSVVADAASVVILAAGHEHHVGHPTDGGDRSIVLVFPPETADEALDVAGPIGGPMEPRVHLGARLIGSSLRRGEIDELETEELALVLLGRIGSGLSEHRSHRPPGRQQHERVERVRALMAAAPDRRWRLEELARAVHCSPFHLARQFRAVTGTSIARALLRLRLALALQRLAEGEADLAALAADLGFASQSHFGARFRSVFETSPGSVRNALTAGRTAELRTFVTAEDRAGS
jgi:AraC family transcriptional regulator